MLLLRPGYAGAGLLRKAILSPTPACFPGVNSYRPHCARAEAIVTLLTIFLFSVLDFRLPKSPIGRNTTAMYTSLSVAIITVSVVFIVLCSVAVALRIQARRIKSLSLKADDYVICGALVSLYLHGGGRR